MNPRCRFRRLAQVGTSYFDEAGTVCGLTMEPVRVKAGGDKAMCPVHDRYPGYKLPRGDDHAQP